MANQEVLDYINSEKQKGVSNEDMRTALLQAGWDASTVDEAFTHLSSPSYIAAPTVTGAQYATFLGPVELLKRSIEIFKDKAQPLIITASPLMVIGLVMALVGPSQKGQTFDAVSSNSMSPLLLMPLQLIEAILSVVIAVTLVTIIVNRSQNMAPMDAFKLNSNRILPFLWVSILTSAVFVGGALFLIIPGVIVYLMVSIAPYIAIHEKIGGLEALVRSRAYTRGYLLGIFGRLLFLVLPIIPILIVFGILGRFATVLSPLITILTTIYMVLIYENIRALKPNVDSKTGGKTRTAFLVLAIIGPLIGVVGVLASITLLAVNPAELLRKARDTDRMSDISTLNKGVQMYNVENGTFPQSLSDLGTEYADALNDPKTNQAYEYTILPNGQGYQICADLESTQNSDRSLNGKYCAPMTADLPAAPTGIE
jgi:hypothetical protein